MFTVEEMNVLIKIMKQIASSECKKILNENNVETIMYGNIIEIDGQNYTVQIAGGDKPYTGLKNKSAETLTVGDSVIVKAIRGNAGNGYIALKIG